MQSAARTGADITHLIGFGILLTAALLVAIGSLGTPTHSVGAGSATEASSFATADSRAPRR